MGLKTCEENVIRMSYEENQDPYDWTWALFDFFTTSGELRVKIEGGCSYDSRMTVAKIENIPCIEEYALMSGEEVYKELRLYANGFMDEKRKKKFIRIWDEYIKRELIRIAEEEKRTTDFD
jgi:hypothetical protein